MGRGHGGSRGGSAGARGFQGDSTMRGYSAGLAKSLTAAESSIRNQEQENAYIFDAQGREIERNLRNEMKHYSNNPKTNALMNKLYNNSRRVTVNPANVTNNIVTHNHPDNRSFSDGDLKAAIQYNAMEMRAVGRTRTYSLRRGAKGWGTDERTAGMAYGRTLNAMKKSDERYIRTYKGDKALAKRRAEETRPHRVMKAVARELGLDYRYSRIQ